MYDYRARIEKVIDGDTVRCLVDHGMYIRSTSNIRLSSVMAPELRKDDPAGEEAKFQLTMWLVEHSDHGDDRDWPVLIYTEKDKQTFNRYIGQVVCGGCHENLNEYMRGLGYR